LAIKRTDPARIRSHSTRSSACGPEHALGPFAFALSRPQRDGARPTYFRCRAKRLWWNTQPDK